MWSTLLLSFLLLGGIKFVHAGQFDTKSAVHENKFFKVASGSMQGRRNTMEDAHSHIFPLTTEETKSAYFGVFDGHGGPNVALLASQKLHEVILKELKRNTNVSEALKKGFMAFDKTAVTFKCEGTTANFVIIKENYLYCANAGDSRAVGSVNGVTIELSIDHKPDIPDETRRIKTAGGSVTGKRINGIIAVSRALGDFIFKQNHKLSAEAQMITALPDVKCWRIWKKLEFVILAYDGVWDKMKNKDAVDFVRERMANGTKPDSIAEELLQHCLDLGSTDNMTVMLVFFLRGNTYSELCETVSPK